MEFCVKKPLRRTKLKVFRAAAGFDNAFVAAPSRKAALEAWGTSKNLFAIGAAEQIDPSEAPDEVFRTPGEVVRRSRGSLADQLKAAGPARSPQRRTSGPTSEKSETERQTNPGERVETKRRTKPKPMPSRAALDRAEAALAAATGQSEQESRAIEEQLKSLEDRKRRAEAAARAKLVRLKSDVSYLSERYSAALEEWAANE